MDTRNPHTASVRPLPAIVGLVIAFGWSFVLLIPGLTHHKITNAHDDLVTILAEWIVVLIIGFIAFRIQHWPPSHFGLRMFGWRDLLAMLAALVAAFVLSGIAGRLVSLPSSVTDLQKLAALPLALRILLVLTAAICEEFMYRGFGIEELALFTGNRWLAGLLALLFFTFGHTGLYGFSLALVVPGLVGAMLTLLYLWRRNLPVCMLMHAIVDGIFILVVPSLTTPHGK